MKLSRSRAARICRDVEQLDFSSVKDPRAERGRRHPLAGVLRLLVTALASGMTTLREAEELSHSLGPRMLRKLGLRAPVSDGCMYELLSRLDFAPGAEVLRQQLRAAVDSKRVRHDLFPLGVLSVDGKGKYGESGASDDPNVRVSKCDAEGTPTWDLFAAQCCLTSSSARVLTNQLFCGRTRTYEGKLLPRLVEGVGESFPKLFDLVTADCGYISEENALVIRGLGKHYVFGLKGKHPKRFALAQEALARRGVAASTSQRAHGSQQDRELRRAPIPEGFHFPDAAELWSVRSLRDGEVLEERYFVVSALAATLDSAHALKLVRLHWGIENGPHWTSDVFLFEDRRCPCTAGSGPSALSWLRMLAFNLLSIVRATTKPKDNRPRPWREAARLLRDALVRFDELVGHDAVPV